MEVAAELSSVIAFNFVSLIIYLLLIFIGNVASVISISKNILLVCKVLCLVQFLIALVQCTLFGVDEKLKNSKKKMLKWLGQFVLLTLCIGIFHIIAVLYGAPAFESVSETLHFACVLGFFSILPSILLNGKSWGNWLTTVFSLGSECNSLTRSVMYTSISTIGGAWVGAFPIPLDWDRPWQVWPISCVYGTVLGHCVGLLVSSLYLISKIRNSQQSVCKNKTKRV